MKTTLSSTLQVTFDVLLENELLDPSNPTLASWYASYDRPQVLVLDDSVTRHYGDELSRYFTVRGIDLNVFELPGGESSKSIERVTELITMFNRAELRRLADPLIVVSGGAVLDTVAVAASLYRRGVPYIRVPTTLLSMVDVSVAAKTGINSEGYRNRIGSYHPPVASLLDQRFLSTLEPEHVSQGLGEIIKLAIIKDHTLFETLEDASDGLLLEMTSGSARAAAVIWRSATSMMEELEPNLWEKDLCRCVDFGHTFSPLIEMRSGLHHGFAVALDCLLSSHIAVARGLLSEKDLLRIKTIIERAGLPSAHSAFEDVGMLIRALEDTVTHRNGSQHAPLPTAIGTHIFVEDITPEEVSAAAQSMSAAAILKN